jgi:hypoxanthine phosphoribosyltransferase
MIETAERMAAKFGSRIERVAFSEQQVSERLDEMGALIADHYRDRGDLLVLGLLKGSFIFLADLVRRIPIPLEIDFLLASSYGSGTISSGDVKLLYNPRVAMKGRNVLVVEDIVDSGNTLARLIPLLRDREPASVEVCALLHKRIVKLDPPARWVGFDAPRDFLVGYGLDYSENFRHLPFIAILGEGNEGSTQAT